MSIVCETTNDRISKSPKRRKRFLQLQIKRFDARRKIIISHRLQQFDGVLTENTRFFFFSELQAL